MCSMLANWMRGLESVGVREFGSDLKHRLHVKALWVINTNGSMKSWKKIAFRHLVQMLVTRVQSSGLQLLYL